MTNEAKIAELEAKRNALYMEYVAVLGVNLAQEREILNQLDAMDAVLDDLEGIEPEEALNTSTNWAEWELDHKIDAMMDERAEMAYEM